MSLALIKREETSLLPTTQTLQSMLQMAESLFKSGLLPSHIKSPQAAFAVIQKGLELGIPPMYSMSSIIVIQGKPTANAELMLALIYRDHGDNAIVFEETTDSVCKIAYKRKGWASPRICPFTIDDAKKAGLLSNQTWQKYPKAMLRARCISAVARLAFPDTIGGMYTPEEIGAQVSVSDDEEITIVEAHQESKLLQLSEPQPIIETEATQITPTWIREFARLKGIDIDAKLAFQKKPGLDSMSQESLGKIYTWLQQVPSEAAQPQEVPKELTATQKQIEYFYNELARSGKERFASWEGQLQNFNQFITANNIEFNYEVSSIADIPDEPVGKRYANYLGDLIAVSQSKDDDPLM